LNGKRASKYQVDFSIAGQGIANQRRIYSQGKELAPDLILSVTGEIPGESQSVANSIFRVTRNNIEFMRGAVDL
jgi:hypothetical protein